MNFNVLIALSCAFASSLFARAYVFYLFNERSKKSKPLLAVVRMALVSNFWWTCLFCGAGALFSGPEHWQGGIVIGAYVLTAHTLFVSEFFFARYPYDPEEGGKKL